MSRADRSTPDPDAQPVVVVSQTVRRCHRPASEYSFRPACQVEQRGIKTELAAARERGCFPCEDCFPDGGER